MLYLFNRIPGKKTVIIEIFLITNIKFVLSTFSNLVLIGVPYKSFSAAKQYLKESTNIFSKSQKTENHLMNQIRRVSIPYFIRKNSSAITPLPSKKKRT